jgi:hypothetical protein
MKVLFRRDVTKFKAWSNQNFKAFNSIYVTDTTTTITMTMITTANVTATANASIAITDSKILRVLSLWANYTT